MSAPYGVQLRRRVLGRVFRGDGRERPQDATRHRAPDWVRGGRVWSEEGRPFYPSIDCVESKAKLVKTSQSSNEPGRVEERTRPSAPTGCRRTSPSLRIAATGRSSRIDRIDPSTTTTNITAYRGRLRVRVRWAPGLNPLPSDGAPSTRRTRARTTEPRRKPARNEGSISAARRYPKGTSKGTTDEYTVFYSYE